MTSPLRTLRRREHSRFSQVAASFIAGAAWCSVGALWISALSVYVSPLRCKWVSLLGLGFPLVLGGTLFMAVIALIFAPRRAWIPLVGILLCGGTVRSFFPINFTQGESYALGLSEKKLGENGAPLGENRSALGEKRASLRVMSYNLHFWGSLTDSTYEKMRDYIARSGAQIVCMQEGLPDVPFNAALQRHFAATPLRHYTYDPSSGSSMALLSAYPIVRKERLSLVDGNGIVAYWLAPSATDSLLVVNCHLRSNQLSPEDRKEYSRAVNDVDAATRPPLMRLSHRLGAKFVNAARVRAAMTDTLARFLDLHRRIPTIVCGDFNDTPVSYARYRIVGCGLTDAFRTKGNGFGRSFNRDAIWVRIDHTFVSDHFEVLASEIDSSIDCSDHFPIRTKLRRRTP